MKGGIARSALLKNIAMWPYPFNLDMSFADTNEQYQLQYTDSLLSNDWTNIGLPIVLSNGETNRPFTDITTAHATNRFYRLITVP